ncbi:hypothetical protein FB451DRAFT_1493391 [Mycena latifolia]|nr:hypothetical protein FB451DRAFT_1493391 [Mycena latifolia]
MRFTTPLFMLAAAAAAAAEICAVCKTLLPGPAEIAWSLVFNREVAENVMFCGYRGAERGNPNPVQTFCTYTSNNGTFIKNYESLQACPKVVKLKKCKD